MDKTNKIMRYPNRIPLMLVDGAVAYQNLVDYVGKTPNYDFAITLGRAALNDGCGSDYYWNSASVEADDGINVVRPTAIDAGSPGRWIRLDRETCKAPKTFKEVHTSDGTADQTVSHTLATKDFTAFVYVDNAGRNQELEFTIEKGTNDAIIHFLNGSEPGNGIQFNYDFTEIVYVAAEALP